ncbi:hypothetical protein JTE90_012548 [Oedothorax gibbosus]|uniref:Uncharacterized protein n=1 Tax=Oedothorax gibbosus TaxID=931172 RepID=A0AAV6TH04_9ARAC|nr:hypothetical protein JTE90_012548 [Oedothorax gibbosus]
MKVQAGEVAALGSPFPFRAGHRRPAGSTFGMGSFSAHVGTRKMVNYARTGPGARGNSGGGPCGSACNRGGGDLGQRGKTNRTI